LILPLSINDLKDERAGDERLKQGLNELSLEDFLEML
jgi:hypothetical protein